MLRATLSPRTWFPILVAGLLQTNDWDKQISQWASSETPLFGSQENAAAASDYLQVTGAATYVITTLVVPRSDEFEAGIASRFKGIFFGASAVGLTHGAAASMKSVTQRERPDDADLRSFPSQHTAVSSAFSTLSLRNLRTFRISNTAKILLGVGCTAMTAGTAWARVEAKKHFPSDVLVGYALGNFISVIINDAFIGTKSEKKSAPFSFGLSQSQVNLGLQFEY
jgi:membrane-associated phospholipid phosphatase